MNDRQNILIPVFEKGVQAGFSSFVGDDETYHLSIEQYLIERPKTTICVRVKGESMRDAGILPEDLVLVDTSGIAKSQDIVIAILDGAYTIKFFCKDLKGRMFLRSAHPDIKDAYPEEKLEIFGVVVAVIRKYA